MSRRKGRGDPRVEQAEAHLREARCESGNRPPAPRRPAQGSQGLEDPRHASPTARHAAQSGRRRAIRDRCEGAGPPGRPGRAEPGVWRQGEELRRGQGEGRAWRATGRADLRRRGRRSRRLLARQEGTRCARHHLGRGPHGQRLERHHLRAVREECRARGRHGPPRWGHPGRAAARDLQGGGGLRAAVPGPRDHGADELHGARSRRWCRYLGAHAIPDGGTGPRRWDRRRAAREGQGSHDLSRRRIRPAVRAGLH